MKLFLAKLAYWLSVGFDNSEIYSGATEKQKEREQRLLRRIGPLEFNKFKHRRWDPKH